MAVTFLTNEDKNILDQQIETLNDRIDGIESSNGASGVVVDNTLTLEGAAADAKATGDALDQLNEEMVKKQPAGNYAKKVSGFDADEDGIVIIKYGTITNRAYRHEGLSKYPKGITVYEDERYTNVPHVFLGKNYFPATTYLATPFSMWGLTLETDGHNFTVTGTAERGTEFMLSPDGTEYYYDIQSVFKPGEVYRLYVFGKISEYNSPFVKVSLYDENKNYIKFTQMRVNAGSNYGRSGRLEIPENAKYARFDIAFNTGDVFDTTIFPVLTQETTEIISDAEFVGDIAQVSTDSESVNICAAPYECVVVYDLELKEYIDSKSSVVDFDMEKIDARRSFVTPEMFGAYGDMMHDDTDAVQACLDYATENNIKMVGGRVYMTSKPLIFSGDKMEVSIKSIRYSGNDAAFVISGSYNHIQISEITSGGCGMRLLSTVMTSRNDIYVGRVICSSNSVELISTAGDIICNRISFNYMEAGVNSSCVYHCLDGRANGVNHNNNCFVGGQFGLGKWGVYGACGLDVYQTILFEGVKNGILLRNAGTCRVIAPRYIELVELSFSKDGDQFVPNEGKGVFLAIESKTGSDIVPIGPREYQFDLSAPGGLLYTYGIDLSAAPTHVEERNGVVPFSKIYPGASRIREKLRKITGYTLCDEFLTFGKHILIDKPLVKRRKSVRVGDTGYEGDYRTTKNEKEFDIFDRFIIEESGCEYTLPPSYDMIAISQFTVEQPEGTSCVFRDWRGTVIFDGAAHGTGVFTVTARFASDSQWDDYENSNQAWDIYKNGEFVTTMMPTNT